MSGMRVVPPGGFSMPPEVPNDVGGYDELVTALRNYRILNGQEIGDPAGDVDRYIHAKNPRAVGILPPPDPFKPDQSLPARNLRDQVSQWAASLFDETISYVEDDEANQRAELCVNCPHNQNWKFGCPPCVDNADRVLTMLNKNQITEQGRKLQACSYYGWENNTACFLDKKHLKVSTYPEVPCWMKS